MKMLLPWHYCELALRTKQGWKKVWKLQQSFCCWKFIFKTRRKEKSLMLWFLTDIWIFILGTTIIWDIKMWIVSSVSQACISNPSSPPMQKSKQAFFCNNTSWQRPTCCLPWLYCHLLRLELSLLAHTVLSCTLLCLFQTLTGFLWR